MAAEARLCPECGTDVQPAMARCRKCGTVLSENGAGPAKHPTNGHGSSKIGGTFGADAFDEMLSAAEITDESPDDAESPIRRTQPRIPKQPAAENHPAIESKSAEANGQPPPQDRIVVACSQCAREVRAPNSLAGKRVKCPSCGTPVTIPRRDADVTQPAGHDQAASSADPAKWLAEYVRRALQEAPPSDVRGPHEESLGRSELKRISKALSAACRDDPSDRACDAATAGIDRLTESGDPRGVALLLEHLDRLPRQQHLHALRALGSLREPGAFERLLRTLESEDELAIQSAVASLGQFGDRRAVKPLIAFAGVKPSQRGRVLDTIEQIGKRAAPDLLELGEGHPDETIRANAVMTLGTLHSPAAISLLTRVARDDAPVLRRLAIDALARYDDPATLRPLVAGLGDADDAVRIAAAAALTRAPHVKLVPFLIRALNDPNRTVRLSIIQALGQCGDADAVAALRPLLSSGDPEVEVQVAESLGRLGDTAAVPRLLQLLEDSSTRQLDLPLAETMVDALRRLKDDRAVLPLIELLDHKNERLRTRAAEALGQIGALAAVEPLCTLLDRDYSAGVQAAAAKALGDLGDRQALPALQSALHQTDLVRCKAIIAMGAIGGRDVVNVIADQLGDTSSQVRYHAATQLGRLGDVAHIPELERLVSDPEDMVRRAAVKAMHELGDERSEAEILKSRREKKHRKPKADETPRAPRVRVRHTIHWRDFFPNIVNGALPDQMPIFAGAIAVAAAVIGLFVWLKPFSSSGPDVPRGYVESACFSGDGQLLAVGRGFGLIEIWDVAGEHTLNSPNVLGKFVAFGPTGRLLLACDGAQSTLLDLETKAILAQDIGVRELVVNRSHTRAAARDTEGNIVVWSFESQQVEAKLEFDVRDTTAFALSDDGRKCLVGTGSGAINIVDLKELGLAAELQAFGPVRSAAFHPNGADFAVGLQSGEILIWNMGETKPTTKLPAPQSSYASFLAFLDADRIVARRGSLAEVWTISTAESQPHDPALESAEAFDVSPDGSRIAIGSVNEGAVVVIDVATGEQTELEVLED